MTGDILEPSKPIFSNLDRYTHSVNAPGQVVFIEKFVKIQGLVIAYQKENSRVE